MTGILNWDSTFQGKVFGNDRPNVFGDRRTRCFAQTQSGLVNGLRVWHCIPFYCICWTLLIIYFCLVAQNLFFTYHPSLRRMSLEVIYILVDDQWYGRVWQCGMLRWNWSRLCWKAGLVVDDQSTVYLGIALCISWLREPHSPIESKTGEGNAGSAHVSF